MRFGKDSSVFIVFSFSMRALFRPRAPSRYAIRLLALLEFVTFARFSTRAAESVLRYSIITCIVDLSASFRRDSISARTIDGNSIRLYSDCCLVKSFWTFSNSFFTSSFWFSREIQRETLCLFASVISWFLRSESSRLCWSDNRCVSLIWRSDSSSCNCSNSLSHRSSRRRNCGILSRSLLRRVWSLSRR